MKMKAKGFTLIEVLVVIVILAVMSALVLPRMTGQTERGYVAEAVQNLHALRVAQQAYNIEHPGTFGTYPQLDVTVDSTGRWEYIVNANGSVTAKRANEGPCPSCTVILNFNGQWGAGTHPNQPQN